MYFSYILVSYQLYYVQLGSLKDNAIKKVVRGIHGELRRIRLCLNNQRPKLVIKENKIFIDVVQKTTIIILYRLNIKYSALKMTRKYPTVKIVEDTSLYLSANIVRFRNYIPGGVYTVSIKFVPEY